MDEETRIPFPRQSQPNGEGCDTRMPLFSHRQSEYRIRGEKNNDGQSLPRVGKVASGASRIGFWWDEKERRRSSQVRRLREHPIHRFSQHNAFPNGEGKEEAASPQKRKPTPPRCARQPLPREGARVDTPSFLWKEVPRRGGGWMGKAVSPKQSLPRVGKVASEASRIGF